MAKPTSYLRLFVGIYPPPDVVAGLVEVISGLELPEHRPTAADQVHLTVQFVGDTPAKQLDGVIESVERAASGIGGFTLTPARLITLPKKGSARLVALTTDAPPPLLELHRRLVHRLAKSPRRGDREGDRFLPHFTLCRFAKPTTYVRMNQPVELPPFDVDRIRLMKSRLRPDGALHEDVVEVEL